MYARKPPRQLRTFALALIVVATVGAASVAAQAPTLTIEGRDRDAHVLGERVGVEVVLGVAGWPPVPVPTGTIRIGDPARPAADCVITLPASPPLGCLWDAGVVGSYQLVASYSGDGAYVPAVSGPVAHQILGPTAPERVSLPDVALVDRNAGSPSFGPVTSVDGRWVAYVSEDQRLVDSVQRVSAQQALLFDRRTGRTTRLSNAPDGTPANVGVLQVAMSGDGRWVAFLTEATNLEPGDTAGTFDWFLADRTTGVVQRLPALRRAPNDFRPSSVALSLDGRFVAFDSLRSDLVSNDTNNRHDAFRLDRNDASVALVSRSTNGGTGDGSSGSVAISWEGRFVAFASVSTDLVAGDTNGFVDVFVRDLQVGTTERVSLSSAGLQVSANASGPSISADGRFVAFMGEDGFAPGDGDGRFDVLVRDRVAGSTLLASIDPVGDPLNEVIAPSISADGTRVVFEELNAGRFHLFDRVQQSLVAFGGIPLGVGGALETEGVKISGDGSSVVFDTGRALVADDRNRVSDVFVYTVSDASTERVSAIRVSGSATGDSAGPPALDDSGSVVAFLSRAGNLVPGDVNGGFDAFVRDRLSARTQLASRVAAGGTSTVAMSSGAVTLSGDGRFVAFASNARDLAPDDPIDASDVFVQDRVDGSIRMVSRRVDGIGSSGSFSPAISRDGRWIVFASSDNSLAGVTVSGVNVYLHDLQSATTGVVPPDGQGSPSATAGEPRLSGDGRYVVFSSTSSTLVPGDTNGVRDVFLFDRNLQSVRRVSVAADGTQGDAESRFPEISADGRYVAFVSSAGNLVGGDTNGRRDVFVAALEDGTIERAGNGAGDVFASARPGLSGDGRYVVFQSSALGGAAGPAASTDVFVFDRFSRQLRTVVPRFADNLGIAALTPSISADGRSIAFIAGSALAPGGVRHTREVFVTDNPIPEDSGFTDGFEGD